MSNAKKKKKEDSFGIIVKSQRRLYAQEKTIGQFIYPTYYGILFV